MIYDQIIKSYLSGFAKDNDFEGLPEDTLFEHFVNYAIASKLFGQLIEVSDVSTGKAFGIDGLAIFVNNQLVLGAEEVNELSRSRLDAHFVFIQSKTSSGFDLGDILKFFEAVKDFFSSKDFLGDSEQVGRFRRAKDQIYKNSIKMEIAPVCELYYVTCGKWQEDLLISRSVEKAQEQLRATGLFSDVKFTAVDADKIKSYYRALKQQVVKQITFEKYAVIPKMADVDQAYIGVLPAKEYLKLITDSDGNLERNLFYDNVRDFQGDNAVNVEISESIRATFSQQNKTNQDKFAILNNGITIVAQEIRPIGTEFTIRDYQVVNGCQTSHVLFFNRAFVTENLYVPVKLVATSSQDVANLVIKATNRQTEVKAEAFAALEPFHKKLEEFYASFTDPTLRLFYERRSRQYDRDNIAHARIVSTAIQSKAYVAMFTGEPHNAHHYYGELLKNYWQGKKEIYQEEQSPWPYYISAASYLRLDKLLKMPSRVIYRPFRHHLLDILGMRFFGNDPRSIHKLSPKRIAAKCQEVIEFWKSEDSAVSEIDKYLAVIESCYKKVGRGESKWDATQRRDFTEELHKASERDSYHSEAPKITGEAINRGITKRHYNVPRMTGKVKRIGAEFGFIADKNGQDVFFHRSNILEDGSNAVAPGSSVEFTPVLAPRGLKAVDVIII